MSVYYNDPLIINLPRLRPERLNQSRSIKNSFTHPVLEYALQLCCAFLRFCSAFLRFSVLQYCLFALRFAVRFEVFSAFCDLECVLRFYSAFW